MSSEHYLRVFLLVGLGFLFSAVVFTVAWLLRARGDDPLKNTVYECGMPAIGQAWAAPNVRFYIFALIFVIFDVEAIFLFPWAVNFGSLGIAGFIEMMIFIAILFAGLIYAWKKDALTWE